MTPLRSVLVGFGMCAAALLPAVAFAESTASERCSEATAEVTTLQRTLASYGSSPTVRSALERRLDDARHRQRESCSTASATPPPRHPSSGAGVAARQEESHPGEKWGFLTVYRDSHDSVGSTITLRVRNTEPNGKFLDLPAGYTGTFIGGGKQLWTDVHGYLRRGGSGSTDVFEVTGVRHDADPLLAQEGQKQFAVAGWRTLHQDIPLTH